VDVGFTLTLGQSRAILAEAAQWSIASAQAGWLQKSNVTSSVMDPQGYASETSINGVPVLCRFAEFAKQNGPI
jgi:hypothetical protein